MVSLELEARLDNLLATSQEETANIDLFAPIPQREECPICLIPLPEDKLTRYMSCCGKHICCGCDYKHSLTEAEKGVKSNELKCAFCCQACPKNNMKALKRLMKKNNTQAFIQMAAEYETGNQGILQSNTRALEMYISAAELGHANAFATIGYHCMSGTAVEQDPQKGYMFYKIAAKKGSIKGHRWLATFNGDNGKFDECIKHLKVLARSGDQVSMDYLMKNYREKLLSKEELTQTLCAFQTSSNEVKSKDRYEVEAFIDANGLVPNAGYLSEEVDPTYYTSFIGGST